MGSVLRRRRFRAFLRRLKARPCIDCGHKFPLGELTWDHVRGVKRFNIGEGIRGRSEEEILAELAKCDGPVCRSCHDRREQARAALRLPVRWIPA